MANKLAEVRNRYLYNIFHYFIERTKNNNVSQLGTAGHKHKRTLSVTFFRSIVTLIKTCCVRYQGMNYIPVCTVYSTVAVSHYNYTQQLPVYSAFSTIQSHHSSSEKC
jgi:hypothetical protein